MGPFNLRALSAFIGVLLLQSTSVISAEISLPKKFICDVKLMGGFSKNNNGAWSVTKFSDVLTFSLEFRRFDQGTKAEIEQCNVASIAAGKIKDDVSILYRTTGRDICMVQNIKDREKFGLTGPILKYCKVSLNRTVDCGDFGFDFEFLEFFDLPPVTMGFSANSVSMSFGSCRSSG